MGNAYECIEKFDKEGRIRQRHRSIGGITVLGLVALAAVLLGRAAVNIPPSFWEFFKK
jgi:hypothetical protein